MQIHCNLQQYRNQVLKNKMRQSNKGHTYFWTNVPGKTKSWKTGAANMRVLLLSRFLNTTRVPNPAHPAEKSPGRSTSIQRQIFWLIQQQNDQTPQVVALSPMLHSSSCPQLYAETVSPPLRAASSPLGAASPSS